MENMISITQRGRQRCGPPTGFASVGSRAVVFVGLLAVALGWSSRLRGQTAPDGVGTAVTHAVVNFQQLAYREQLGGFVPAGAHVTPWMSLSNAQATAGGPRLSQPFSNPSATAAGPNPLSPPPASSFAALGDDGFEIPPDTHGAVGPNHLMVTLNTQVRIQDRTGGNISTVSLNSFWSILGNLQVFDPKVLYDPYNSRWIFTAGADGMLPTTSVLMGVSQTSDPTGNWFLYRVRADTNGVYWADYPSLGFNKDWIVVTVNMFPDVGNGYLGANLYIFNKADLYANGPGRYTLRTDYGTPGFTMTPAITYDTNLATLYLVEQDLSVSNSTLRVSTITGNVGAEILTLGTAFLTASNGWTFNEPFDPVAEGSAPELGTTRKIETNDSRVQNVVYRNGNLWCTHTIFLPAGAPTRSAVQWWQFSPTGSLLQLGRLDDPVNGTWYAFPSIAVNKNEDVLIGFSRFSPFQYASANYAFRSSFDPPGTLEGDVVLKAGEAPYFKDFGGGQNRWGDFSSTVVDPVNDTDMWTIQEYAATPFGGQDRWGTWWGRLDVLNLSPFRFEFSSATYSVAENIPGFATITVNNIGGSAGSVDYAASGGTAISGTDYIPVTGTLNFTAGQLSNSFPVQIIDNSVANSNKTVNLMLSNPQGGATLGFPTNAVLTIIDDESQAIPNTSGEFNFSSAIYFVTEDETFPAPFFDIDERGEVLAPDHCAYGALITVVRTNGATGRVLVDYATVAGGTAIAGINYNPVSGTLIFDDYQMSTNFLVEIGYDFSTNNILTFFNVQLSNPRPDLAGGEDPFLIKPALGLGSVATVAIIDINSGLFGTNNAFNIERAFYRVDEDPSAFVLGGRNSFPTSFGRTIVSGTGILGQEGQTRNLYIDVMLLPRGGPGTVQVFVFPQNGVFGGEYGYPAAAGSDYADALAPNDVGPLPIITDPSLTYSYFPDYLVYTTNITFAANQFRRRFILTVKTDPLVEFNEDLLVHLFPLNGEPPLGFNSFANVSILYNDQPAGALDREWNLDNSAQTTPPFNHAPGANNTVHALAVQPDGKAILAGDFTSINAIPRSRIGRMNIDGSIDLTFTPGLGADDFISAVVLYPAGGPNAGSILVVGGFTSFNGSQRNGIVRLSSDGTVDSSFAPGNGANAAIRSVALQPDGRILISGDFTFYNDQPTPGFARLDPNGGLDTTFDAGSGADNTVWAITFDSAGRVLIGGDFLSVNTVLRNGIARLNVDGSADTSFDPGTGADGSVYAIAVQTDGQILVGGAFTQINLTPRSGIARLNPGGSLDATFNPGQGANGSVYVIALQSDNKALIGGLFTSFDNTRRLGLARLKPNGNLDTTFLDTAYNQFAGFINTYHFQPPNYINAIIPYTGTRLSLVSTQVVTGTITNMMVVTNAVPQDYVMVGGSFAQVGGNPSYTAPLRNPWTIYTRADKRPRHNVARLMGGVTPGPGNAEFNETQYFVDENGGSASIRLRRVDGRLGTLQAFSVTSNRIAQAGVDFTFTQGTNTWPEFAYVAPRSIGLVDFIFDQIPVINDNLQDGNKIADLYFLRPNGGITLGGEFVPLGGALGRYTAPLTIIDDNFNAGIFNFSSPNFATNEGAGRAIISVIRTNGSQGPVSVDYFTSTNKAEWARYNLQNPATPGQDFTVTRGTLTFASGQTNRTFSVQITPDNIVEFDENVLLVLTNATGGAKLPDGLPTSVATATLTIIDDDFLPGRLNFAATNFIAAEADGFAPITVTRSGGSLGAVSAEFQAVSGASLPAIVGADFVPTNGVLSWADNDANPKTFLVPLLTDGVVDGPKTVTLFLTNASQNMLLGSRSNSVLTILDSDAYGSLGFNQPFYEADENGGSMTLTVVRSGGIAGMISVDCSTLPGVGTAVPGADYIDTTNTLTFMPGEFSKTFTVTLVDDNVPDGNKTLVVALSNPTPVPSVLGAPSIVTNTIIDNESFNIPAGSLDTTFSTDAQTDGPVNSVALQSDGGIMMAGDFSQVSHVPRTRIARLMTNGVLDPTFNPAAGPNGSVRTMALQRDGKILIGGFFSQVDNTNRNSIARLYTDGTLDAAFNPGAGADNPVHALAIQPDDKILLGGAFSSFNNVSRPGIVRLNTNGTVDARFTPGAGANGTVFAVALQTDGKILIGGDFTAVAGTPINRLARLNRDGSLDTSFAISNGFDAAVRAILVQPDGRIVAGGSFNNFNGTAQPSLARLNADGTLDTGFLAGLSGADNAVYALAQQVDGKLVVAGAFGTFNGVTRNRLTRLNPDGTTDPSINFGDGANSFVFTLVIQPDRSIVLGGGFTLFEDQPHAHIARIYGGSIAGAGGLEFAQSVFTTDETAGDVLITVRRRGGTAGTVSVNYSTSDGTAVAPSNYLASSGTLTFLSGETQQGFLVPIRDDFVVTPNLTVNLALSGYSGGATSGPQPVATLVIVNDESRLSFSSISYSVSESSVSGNATISVIRSGATNKIASVNFQTTPTGSAIAGTDYFPTNGTLTFLPGVTRLNFNVRIQDDLLVENNETLGLALTNPSGFDSLGIATATLTIVNSHFAYGQLQFSSFTYTNFATDPSAAITVVRTNGYSGAVSVSYSTRAGSAVAGSDYVATNGNLSFAEGETVKTFLVPLISHPFRLSAVSLTLNLSSPTGGATLGNPTNATLTIIDNRTPAIIAAGAVLQFESGLQNNAIDPNENVTVSFALRNIGLADTGDIMATLLPGNGVTMPPGTPQDYGVLLAAGLSAVSRPFNFTAVGANGDRLLATLLLTDGGVTNGTVTFAFTLGGRASVSRTNSNFITINDNANATPYPSTIDVANVGGTVTKVTATLSNINHGYTLDVDVLLVSPSGQEVVLMGDTGGPHSLTNVTLTFDDAAANKLPAFAQITNGTYKPTIDNILGSVGAFVPPAPPPPFTNTFLSVFNGSDPNGTWSLYVIDDATGGAGNIAGGWSLTINTSDIVTAPADLSVSGASAPEPVLVGANLTNTVSLMNHGPATASNVVMHAVMPESLILISASSTLGVLTHSAGGCVCNIGTLTNGQGATVTIVSKTTVAGALTNLVSVDSTERDPNPGDNSAALLTTVMPVPRLVVFREGNNIILSWPAPAASFVLESTAALSPPNWAPVSAAQIVVGAQVQVSETALSGSRFYRLREP